MHRSVSKWSLLTCFCKITGKDHWISSQNVYKIGRSRNTDLCMNNINRRANGLLNSCLTWFTKVFLYKCSRTVPSKGIVNRVDHCNLYMAVNEIHHSQMHPTLTLVGVNEIHKLIMIFMARLTRVTLHEGLDRGLELNSGLACHFLLNFQATFIPFN